MSSLLIKHDKLV